eukprot:scaffold7377_cov257-Pinguiococcus_pyrenoidosus.AAC.11
MELKLKLELELEPELKLELELEPEFKMVGGPASYFVFIPPAGDSETKAKDLDLSMVPAEEARQSGEVPKTMINFQDLSRAADMKFPDKVTWFQDVIRGVRVPWEEGHMQIRVRRSDLLHDAQVRCRKGETQRASKTALKSVESVESAESVENAMH